MLMLNHIEAVFTLSAVNWVLVIICNVFYTKRTFKGSLTIKAANYMILNGEEIHRLCCLHLS